MKKSASSKKSSAKKAGRKPIEKRYNKSGDKCKVTFRLPREAVENVSKVNLVGEFNNWSIEQTPLEKLKNGEFKVTLDLEAGKEYRFKFLIDGQNWENHWNADKYVKNQFGYEDSVVST